ncbi:8-amino-7-oxononanoate synthase [Actimicrobium sp. GrIS 1.19]|uniref:8-amino-7-oxononanoate synthase n=1 Tax=Actimicrobium sp. GrIS 1.19 TaxID=3071708 RepID=UPI002DFE0383|nr:8-amino-7-oxononanoate synthase [Actimicrobium sp. GrIS 1.19]
MTNALLTTLAQRLRELDTGGLRRRRRITDTPCAPQLTIDGAPVLAFCSNDYLGLAAHPQIVEALREGASLYGAGSGASHLISGHSRAHALLEDRLAEFMQPVIPSARALYFSNGYMANLAVVSALAERGTDLFCEALNHASLIDGARLSRATVKVYAHGAVDQLAALLAASDATNKVVVTDSVFSMDGDLAPLAALLALCEQHNAWLVVDDAHGFGVLGQRGLGAFEHVGIYSTRLVYMGTLGKAAGVSGAFIAAHDTVIEWLLQRARPYIYTTAAPPALAHALLTSLAIIGGPEGAQRRTHLNTLIAQFRAGLRLRDWQALPSDTAIQPIIIGANDSTMAAAATLYGDGIWVGAIRPPTVAPGTARLRVTLSAAHSSAEVTRLVDAINRLQAA